MHKKGLKAIVAALTITAIGSIFAGCGNKNTDSQSGKEQYTETITALGSTALQKLVEQAANNFKQKYPEATINVQGGGSGAGINQVLEGSVEIGNSDIFAEEKLKDRSKELVDHKVCGIGFAVVVNKDVNIDSITSSQIQDIFTGKVTNWKEVGGKDLPINIINRPKSSGTRTTFKNTVMGGKDEKDGLGTIQDSNGSVGKAIESTSGAISYLALSYLTGEAKNNLKVLKIDGIEATNENIAAGKYKFWSYEHMYTKGEAKGLSKAFIDYMMSKENEELILKLGYIPADRLK